MNCSFPLCSLNCLKCSEYIGDNTPKDELLQYIEDNEADTYLSSLEAQEQLF